MVLVNPTHFPLKLIIYYKGLGTRNFKHVNTQLSSYNICLPLALYLCWSVCRPCFKFFFSRENWRFVNTTEGSTSLQQFPRGEIEWFRRLFLKQFSGGELRIQGGPREPGSPLDPRFFHNFFWSRFARHIISLIFWLFIVQIQKIFSLTSLSIWFLT